MGGWCPVKCLGKNRVGIWEGENMSIIFERAKESPQ